MRTTTTNNTTDLEQNYSVTLITVSIRRSFYLSKHHSSRIRRLGHRCSSPGQKPCVQQYNTSGDAALDRSRLDTPLLAYFANSVQRKQKRLFNATLESFSRWSWSPHCCCWSPQRCLLRNSNFPNLIIIFAFTQHPTTTHWPTLAMAMNHHNERQLPHSLCNHY